MIELNRKTYFEVFEKGKYDDPIGFIVFKGGEWKFRQFKKDTHITSDVMRSIADTIINIKVADDDNNKDFTISIRAKLHSKKYLNDFMAKLEKDNEESYESSQ